MSEYTNFKNTYLLRANFVKYERSSILSLQRDGQYTLESGLEQDTHNESNNTNVVNDENTNAINDGSTHEVNDNNMMKFMLITKMKITMMRVFNHYQKRMLMMIILMFLNVITKNVLMKNFD